MRLLLLVAACCGVVLLLQEMYTVTDGCCDRPSQQHGDGGVEDCLYCCADWPATLSESGCSSPVGLQVGLRALPQETPVGLLQLQGVLCTVHCLFVAAHA